MRRKSFIFESICLSSSTILQSKMVPLPHREG